MRFWIAKGTSLPVLRMTLVDGSGNPVSLADATGVEFHLYKKDGTEVTLAGDAEIESDDTVIYKWGSADTADDGDYTGRFVVDSASDSVAYPVLEALQIAIGSLDGSYGTVLWSDVRELRLRAGEIGNTMFSDAELAEILVARNGELAASAYDVWSIKAADAANLVDYSEAGSSRSVGSLYKNCMEMADFWAKQSPIIQASLAAAVPPSNNATRSSRTRGVTRA